MKTNLEIINENLPLIDLTLSKEEKISMAKKKLDFVRNNSGLFPSTGSYVITLQSVKDELEEIEKQINGGGG